MNPLLDIGGFDQWTALDRSTKPTKLFETLGEAAETRVREEFARWLLRLLQAQVRECIRSQRFPEDYAPLSPAWAERKERQGLNPGFWIAAGVLVDTLTVWKERGESVWHLGWPAGRKHPDNDQPLATIAASLELGVPERNLPARPLFTTLASRMKRQAYRLFYAFCREKHPRYLTLLPRP